MKVLRVMLSLLLMSPFVADAETINEVFEPTGTKVIVREHPKTGQTYVSIIDESKPMRKDLLSLDDVAYARPDYGMLETDVKPGSYEYEGPYSSRKKVYILAGTLATMGVVSYVAIPTAAATGAAGSGIGAGVTTGVLTSSGLVTAAMVNKKSDLPDDYVRRSESVLLETDSDFYKMHIEGNNV